MSKLTAPKNEFGIDIAKIWAMFSVLSLHLFLYSNYYNFAEKSFQAVCHATIRMLFYQCVPLFLVITGYLKRNAEFSLKHYYKLIPVLISYVVCALIVIAYKIFYLHESFSILIWAQSIWSFNQPTYAWYLNAYVSLYLIMPFINAAYKSLETHTQKRVAVIVVVFVTMFATTINKIPIKGEIIRSLGIGPTFFQKMWPVAYYVLGMYIGDVKLKIKKWFGAILLLVLLAGEAVIAIVTTPNIFNNGLNFTNEDCVNVPVVMLIFLLLYDIKCKNIPIRRIAAKASSVSLNFLLISAIGDNYFYNKNINPCLTYSDLPKRYLKIIPRHFLLALIVSIIAGYIVMPINSLIMMIFNKLCGNAKVNEKIIL